MPWVDVTGLAGASFKNSTAEEHFVRNSALILAMGEVEAGYPYLIRNISRRDNGEFLVTLGYVSTGNAITGSGRDYVAAGTECAWSTNATDMSASSTEEGVTGRGRRIRSGVVQRTNASRTVVVLHDDEGNNITDADAPDVGDVIFFKKPCPPSE